MGIAVRRKDVLAALNRGERMDNLLLKATRLTFLKNTKWDRHSVSPRDWHLNRREEEMIGGIRRIVCRGVGVGERIL